MSKSRDRAMAQIGIILKDARKDKLYEIVQKACAGKGIYAYEVIDRLLTEEDKQEILSKETSLEALIIAIDTWIIMGKHKINVWPHEI